MTSEVPIASVRDLLAVFPPKPPLLARTVPFDSAPSVQLEPLVQAPLKRGDGLPGRPGQPIEAPYRKPQSAPVSIARVDLLA
jgi:hypothetical protein